MWDQHKNWFGKIITIRNEKTSHYTSETTKVSKQDYDEMWRILFPRTPKEDGKGGSDGALLRACDLRSVFDLLQGKTGRVLTVAERQ